MQLSLVQSFCPVVTWVAVGFPLKRLQSSKLNIHVHSHVLQEKQPDVIIVSDDDSKSGTDTGKKTNVSNISSVLFW